VNRKRNSSPDIHPVLGFWRGLFDFFRRWFFFGHVLRRRFHLGLWLGFTDRGSIDTHETTPESVNMNPCYQSVRVHSSRQGAKTLRHFGAIPFAVFIMLWGTLFAQARTQPEMLFVTKENCALIRGYSKHDIAGVSREFNLPVSKIRYVRAEWGRGQEGFEQCNLVFSTPQGNKSCKVFNIMKDEFVFAFAVPIPGNHAICN